MDNFLRELLPQVLPEGYGIDINFFIRPHQGWQDLRKSIPKKVKVFSHFHQPTKIIIIEDQDNKDCKSKKQEIVDLCKASGNCPTLIRIACQELESWYLGDMGAIEAVYPSFKAEKYQNKKKFRNPEFVSPSYELKKMIPGFQKGLASREIPKHMKIGNNKSISFQQLISGIEKILRLKQLRLSILSSLQVIATPLNLISSFEGFRSFCFGQFWLFEFRRLTLRRSSLFPIAFQPFTSMNSPRLTSTFSLPLPGAVAVKVAMGAG